MAPQVTPNWTEPEVEVPSAAPAESSSLIEAREPHATQEPADAKQEGPEMAWAGIIVIGTLLLLVSTGLGVAVALGINIVAWLFGGALLVLVIVFEANVVDRAMLRTLTAHDKKGGQMK